MASPVSSIRSAARGTYSAYKRQPIRWRLAGGSAALTLVILLGFAVIVGTLTTQRDLQGLQPPGGVGGRPAAGPARLPVRRARQRAASRSTSTSGVDLDVFAGRQQRGDPRRHRLAACASTRSTDAPELRPAARGERRDRRLARRDARAPARARRPRQYDSRLRPVRPPDLGRPRHRQPREAVPRPGRARRRRARAARRPGHRAPRDGADRRAHRRPRARSSARATRR